MSGPDGVAREGPEVLAPGMQSAGPLHGILSSLSGRPGVSFDVLLDLEGVPRPRDGDASPRLPVRSFDARESEGRAPIGRRFSRERFLPEDGRRPRPPGQVSPLRLGGARLDLSALWSRDPASGAPSREGLRVRGARRAREPYRPIAPAMASRGNY
jgi:hypothetical protein